MRLKEQTKKHRVIFLTQYNEIGASSRLCVYIYLPYFKKAGIEFNVRPLLGDDAYKILGDLAQEKSSLKYLLILFKVTLSYIKRYKHVVEAWSYDVAVVQKDVLPFGLRLLLELGQKKIIFIIDDPIWLPHPSSGESSVMGTFTHGYRRLLVRKIIQAAQLVIADSPSIARYAIEHGTKAAVLRTGISLEEYKVSKSKKNELPVLGWIGSPSTTYLLQALFPFLELLAKKVPFVLQNVGGTPLNSTFFEVRNINWSPQNELSALAEFDLGLMPSDDREFNKSRFSRKSIIYSCAAVPTLAPDIGYNSIQVKNNETGLLYDPNSPTDFVEKASLLLMDKELSLRLGKEALRQIKVHDLSIVADHFIQMVKAVVEGNPIPIETPLPPQ